MKRYIVIYMTLAATVLVSCDKFLTVASKNQVTRESLIKDGAGFRTALNGVYLTLSSPELYGQELSFATLSIMGQNYNVTSSYSIDHLVYAPSTYNYGNAGFEKLLATIWEKAYYAIANCNMIIEDIQKADVSIFQEGSMERDLILAEARGLRAVMHFDLLRLFAPAPIVNPTDKYIPYVTTYPSKRPATHTVSEVMGFVIEDLKFAAENLEYNDLDYNSKMMGINQSYPEEKRFYTSDIGKGGQFFSLRGTRLNCLAAYAMLARAYLYNGQKEEAYTYASKVYAYRTWFPFSRLGTVSSSSVNSRQPKLIHDIIFSLYNSKMEDIYNDWYKGRTVSSTVRLAVKNALVLFKDETLNPDAITDDYRFQYLLSATSGSGYTLKWEPRVIDDYTKRFQAPLIPMIRMSEIYYIMCEYLADTNLPLAIEMLQAVRSGRNATTQLSPGLTKEEFLEWLYIDITRESIAEGQTFFLYKRLNRAMYNGTTPIDMTGKYVIPIPLSATAY